jgi:hypothetical protein
MRLNNTVVLYDNEPVYITGVGAVGAGDPKPDIFRVYAQPLPYVGGGKFGGRILPDGKEEQMRKFISSKKFDLAPFPMGFVNKKGHVHYTSRAPRRQQKQGLSDATFTSQCLLPHVRALDFTTAISSQEFVDCIKGKYPSVQEATEMLKDDNVKSVAFCRTFALVKDAEIDDLIYLYHKMNKVGFILEQQLKLTKLAGCLKEALREVGVKC